MLKRKPRADVQQDAQQTADSDATAAQAGASASTCERQRVSEPASPNGLTPRVNSGWFKPGQPGPRLTHGLYSDGHPAAAAIVAEVERFLGAQLTDEGGAEADLGARRGSLIAYRGRIVHKNILKLSQALEDRGIFDGRGRLRVAWLQQLGALLDKAVRLDALLGLERRPRRTQSPIEWLNSIGDAQQKGHAPDHDDDETRTTTGAGAAADAAPDGDPR